MNPGEATGLDPTAFAGVRVLDLAHTLAGPYAAQVLADLGCDVVKVESPGGGDASRRSLGRIQHWGESSAFFAVNRNKRSIVLDLKTRDGLDAFRELAATADVVIESFRPGTAARLGIDYPTLRERNERIIYASVSGFGSTGPYARRGGYDIVAQAMSGIMSVTGEPDGAPAKAGVPVTDVGAGLFCAIGVLAALQAREHTGRGQRVDTSLFEAGIAYGVWEATELWTEGTVPERMGSAHRMTAPYQAVRTQDGYIIVAANNDALWGSTATALGRPDWLEDPRFASVGLRLTNRAELVEAIESVTATAPSATWLQTLNDAGVPAGPVNDYPQVFDDPHTQARGMVLETEHPIAGPIRMIGSPLKMSDLPMGLRRRPPLLGEHTEEVLRDIGLDEDLVRRLTPASAETGGAA
jgi:crotonobetainyl-CoA:carnitine CoA-transferase CaiB-like acyl-CoA transferase